MYMTATLTALCGIVKGFFSLGIDGCPLIFDPLAKEVSQFDGIAKYERNCKCNDCLLKYYIYKYKYIYITTRLYISMFILKVCPI